MRPCIYPPTHPQIPETLVPVALFPVLSLTCLVTVNGNLAKGARLQIMCSNATNKIVYKSLAASGHATSCLTLILPTDTPQLLHIILGAMLFRPVKLFSGTLQDIHLQQSEAYDSFNTVDSQG